MTLDQAAILIILTAAVAMFIWGRWRHDMIALGTLLAAVLVGVVPAADAFSGFSHPAVITVACVLALSTGLQQSGAVDVLTRTLLPQKAGWIVTLAALTGLAALLSAFMNNVGALALLMPVALQIATRQNIPPGRVLMPLAFASILGGMTTLIGTPPNLVVSGFRAQTGYGGFAMFDYAPVGIAVAAVGLAFVILFSRWLVPARSQAAAGGFEIGAYLTEARVMEKSKAAGLTLREIDKLLEEADAQIVGLAHESLRIPAPNPFRTVRSGDILVIEAEPQGLASALTALGLKLEEDVRAEAQKISEDNPENAAENAPSPPINGAEARTARKAIESEEIILSELAVLPGSDFTNRSATDIRLRSRYGINLLAISRQGRRSLSRLRTTTIRPGDVMLMQGTADALREFAAQFGCVPLAERPLRIPNARNAWVAAGIMAISVLLAAIGALPAAVSFAGGVLAAMASRVVSPRTVYDAIDWPVIVLLGALIPVAGALAATGAADQIARLLLNVLAQGHSVMALALILIVAMTLSDFMNNTATAAVMCPIAIGAAEQLGVSADPFLMAVAIGSSCAFLTPIGHQNNTLIMGPGGFGFRDYWRLGLPLEILVVAVGLPLLLTVWPL